jgi:glycosyltransferase involved in cell wall biosynthesis
LIVVDDGSTDGTRELLRGLEESLPIRVLDYDRNQGKGAGCVPRWRWLAGSSRRFLTRTWSMTLPTWVGC